MKKISKGEYGYINYQKKWTLIRTIIYFAISISIFVIGIVTTGDRKNLLTIVAVLGCLPASKSLVNAVMFFRAKGCSELLHNQIKELNGHYYELYDLYMTSYKKNYPLSHVVMAENMLICFSECGAIEPAQVEKHIEEHLKMDGFKNVTVKAFSEKDKYLARLSQLNGLEIKPLPIQDAVLEMLLSISL